MTSIDRRLEYQYVHGQGRPHFARLLAEFEQDSARVSQTQRCSLDLRYGSGPRQTFDWFAAEGTARGTVAYFHAGYWQARDKGGFRWLAPAFTAQGYHFAPVNYPLCPAVRFEEVVASAKSSIQALRMHAQAAGHGPLPLIAAGHSAGAHLVVEIALEGLADEVLAISGVFDLVPLLATSLNERLALDEGTARKHSPLHRVRPGLPAARFVVGSEETPAFVEQSRLMQEAWHRAGNASSFQVVDRADHFTVLRSLMSEFDPWDLASSRR